LLLAGGAHFFDYLVLATKAWGLTLGWRSRKFLAIATSRSCHHSSNEARRVAQRAGAR